MYEYLEVHDRVAIVGPRMVGKDGDYQQSCYHFTLLDARQALRFLIVLLGGRGSSLFGLSANPAGDGSRAVEVDWVYAACALVRREALDEVGLLDEDLFIYGEDMDLCYRFARAGWKTIYLPQAEITHYGNQSGVQVFGDPQGFTRVRMYVEGIDYFQRKYFSAAHSYIIRALICAGSAAAAALLGLLYILRGGDSATGARSAYAAKVAAASLCSMLAAQLRSTADMKERQNEMRTLVVILAYNEEESIGAVVSEVRRELEADVLVVDDGSEDGTWEKALQAGARCISLAFNAGIGVAEQAGLQVAAEEGYDFVIRMDGDGQHDPANITLLLDALQEKTGGPGHREPLPQRPRATAAGA